MKPRYSDRKSATCKVTLSAGARVGDGHLIDLTVPGCQLHTTLALEAGQSVQLHVQLDGRKPLRVDLGVVRWVHDKAAGIEFIRMSEEDQLRLRGFVGYIERRRVNEAWSETLLCVGY